MRLTAAAVFAGAASSAAAAAVSYSSSVPSVSAIATPAHVDRAPEPGFQGGFVNDQPVDQAYLPSTKTFTLPAVTVDEPADDKLPATTWTLPATTLTITEAPTSTKALAARGDLPLSDIQSHLSSAASVLSSALNEVSILQQSTAEKAPPVVTSAPSLPKALADRQDDNPNDGCDAICTLDGLLSIIASASSASEYWSWVAASISSDLYEETVTNVNTVCATIDGTSSCRTDTLFFATQNPPTPPAARAEITSPPAAVPTNAAREEGHDAIYTLSQLISTLLSAQSAYDYYSWLAASISMELHESTVTFQNEACATVDGIESCSTETLFFATQNPPTAPARQIRAEATPTASTVPSVEPAKKHDTISVVTKTVTTSETIVKPSTTFTSTFTTIDTCTEYIGGKCMQKRDWPSLVTTVLTRSNDHTTITTTQECRAYQGTCIDIHTLPPRSVEARQEGNPCSEVGCVPYTTITRDFPDFTATYSAPTTTVTTTIPAHTTTETWYSMPGQKREKDEVTMVTESVAVATVTAVVTSTSAAPPPSSDTTCTDSTTATVCSASSCSTSVLPVTANSTTTFAGTAGTAGTTSITTTVNGTLHTSTAGPSTTAELGGVSSDAEVGKQVGVATVGMAFFAVLAFFL